jgi:hypothetical protein
MYGLLIQHPMDAQFEGCFHAGQHANDKFVQRKIIYVQHYLFIFGIAKKKKKVSIRYIYFSLTIPLLRSTGINITYLDTGEGSECLCMYLGLSAEVPGMYTKLRIMLQYIIKYNARHRRVKWRTLGGHATSITIIAGQGWRNSSPAPLTSMKMSWWSNGKKR